MFFSISPAISLVISAPGSRTPRAAWQVIQVDQNFGRSHRADARVAPCIIPKGKYVVTGSHWRLLGRLRLRSDLGELGKKNEFSKGTERDPITTCMLSFYLTMCIIYFYLAISPDLTLFEACTLLRCGWPTQNLVIGPRVAQLLISMSTLLHHRITHTHVIRHRSTYKQPSVPWQWWNMMKHDFLYDEIWWNMQMWIHHESWSIHIHLQVPCTIFNVANVARHPREVLLPRGWSCRDRGLRHGAEGSQIDGRWIKLPVPAWEANGSDMNI